MNYKIDEMTQYDWNQAANIYLEGIKTGKATFQKVYLLGKTGIIVTLLHVD